MTGGDWQPQLEHPHVAIFGSELFAPTAGHEYLNDITARKLIASGLLLSEALLDTRQSIAFPASHETTLVDNPDQVFKMDYVPDMFNTLSTSPEAQQLHHIYTHWLPLLIRNELDIVVEPMTGRNAEAFITDKQKGQQLDPHTDERVTVAYYPNPGMALLVSHCINARNETDMREQPATLVYPRMDSYVINDGTRFPHLGISTGIIMGDSDEVCLSKTATIHKTYNIAQVVSNLYNTRRVRIGKREKRFIDPRLLAAYPGLPRMVISMNLARVGTDDAANSSLDAVFADTLGET